jgi:uncharacterized protein DUF6920
MKFLGIGVLVLFLGLATTILVAGRRWRSATNALIGRLETPAGQPVSSAELAREIDSVPRPVARYFHLALGAQLRPVLTARAQWRGDFLLRPTADGWRSFRATQIYHTRPPGFIWDARISMAPGLNVWVRDGFVDGGGSMRGAVLGVIPIINVHGTSAITAGALQRYLGEAIWFPTALLPRYGVHWTLQDDSTARATLTVASTTVSLDFRFGSDGFVESVYSSSRFRDVHGTAVPTPWEARVTRYVEHDGIRVPATGEAAWLLPEGRLPYWRGELVALVYEMDAR